MAISKFTPSAAVPLSLAIMMLGFFTAIGTHDGRPRLPDHFRNKTPPAAAALAKFREKSANGGWIGRSQRELAELIGPPFSDHLSCSYTSECTWLIRKDDDDPRDPNGVIVEVLYTESGGMMDNVSGVATYTAANEPAIHLTFTKEHHFRK